MFLWDTERQKRHRENIEEDKDKKKEVAVVLMIDRTTDGKLLKTLRETEMDCSKTRDYMVKVMERPGTTIRDVLCSDKKTKYLCGRQRCSHCLSKKRQGDFRHPCIKSNLVYKGRCNNCYDNKKTLQEIMDLLSKKLDVRLVPPLLM